MKRLMLSGCVAALLAGCASIERTSPGMMDGLDVIGGDSPAEYTVCARVSGYGLLYLCTGICGDIDYNKQTHDIYGGFLLFQDKCNCTDCYRTLQDLANDTNRQLTNVNYFNNSLPQQGITGYADLICWFFECEDVGCSGVLRKKKGN